MLQARKDESLIPESVTEISVEYSLMRSGKKLTFSCVETPYPVTLMGKKNKIILQRLQRANPTTPDLPRDM